MCCPQTVLCILTAMCVWAHIVLSLAVTQKKMKNRQQKVFTLKQLITITLFFLTTLSSGQKFMIVNNDTLPYKEEIQIIDGDTSYLGACWTFEKVNGQIINQSDDHCLRQGIWYLTDSVGNYSTGIYKDGNAKGIWKEYNKYGKLLKITEEVSLGDDSYKIKEIDYSSGHALTVVDRAFLAFYIKNFYIIVSIIFGSFFGRILINSRIYNVENGTNYSPIVFFFPGYVSKNFTHNLLCTFTLWFFKYKPENKKRVFISNILSLIAFGTFIGLLIGLGINGELH